MGNILIAFLASVGSAGWLYARFLRRTGGNQKSSIVPALVLGIFVFVIVWTFALTIDSMIG